MVSQIFSSAAAAAAGYRVVLQVVTASGTKGNAAYHLVLPIPPSGGTCTSAPTTGAALRTQFFVRCSDWSADNLPLSYSFSSRTVTYGVPDPGPLNPDLSWTPANFADSTGMYLPAGNYTLASTVYDAVGARAVTDAAGGPILVLDIEGDEAAYSAVLAALVDHMTLEGAFGPAIGVMDTFAASLNSALPSWESSCSGNPCRRLLGSSMAYRMAIRRLLLQKLSGLTAAGAGTTTTAPALLRASRRAAAVPAELSADGPAAGAAALSASLAVMSVSAVRAAGTLQDAATLAMSILNAAAIQPPTNSAPDEFEVTVAKILLGALVTYATGMVSGENPLSVLAGSANRQGVALEATRNGPGVMTAGAIVDWVHPENTSESLLLKSPETSAQVAGISVVRLFERYGPALTDGESSTPLSDIVSIRVIPPFPSVESDVWVCPSEHQSCVRFVVALEWTAGSIPSVSSYQCLRWDGDAWNSSGCNLLAEPFVNRSNPSLPTEINCSCNMDGIFTASISSVKTDIVVEPVLACALARVHSGGCAAVLGSICVALAGFCIAVALAALKKLKHGGSAENLKVPTSNIMSGLASVIEFSNLLPFRVQQGLASRSMHRLSILPDSDLENTDFVKDSTCNSGHKIPFIFHSIDTDISVKKSKLTCNIPPTATSECPGLSVSVDLVFLSPSGDAQPLWTTKERSGINFDFAPDLGKRTQRPINSKSDEQLLEILLSSTLPSPPPSSPVSHFNEELGSGRRTESYYVPAESLHEDHTFCLDSEHAVKEEHRNSGQKKNYLEVEETIDCAEKKHKRSEILTTENKAPRDEEYSSLLILSDSFILSGPQGILPTPRLERAQHPLSPAKAGQAVQLSQPYVVCYPTSQENDASSIGGSPLRFPAILTGIEKVEGCEPGTLLPGGQISSPTSLQPEAINPIESDTSVVPMSLTDNTASLGTGQEASNPLQYS